MQCEFIEEIFKSWWNAHRRKLSLSVIILVIGSVKCAYPYLCRETELWIMSVVECSIIFPLFLHSRVSHFYNYRNNQSIIGHTFDVQILGCLHLVTLKVICDSDSTLCVVCNGNPLTTVTDYSTVPFLLLFVFITE